MATGARNKTSQAAKQTPKATQDISKVQYSTAEGIDYLYGFYETVDPWDVTSLDIRKIGKFKENVYAQKIATNLANLIFQGPPVINILDPKGNSREDIAEWYRPMLNSEAVDFEEKLHRTVDSWLYYGTFIHSDTIEEKETKILLTEIRDLPPESFGVSKTSATPGIQPATSGIGKGKKSEVPVAEGRILKGIVRYGDGSVHYFQTQYTETVEINNCTHIRAPKYGYYIDGVPLLAPLYKLIPKMNNSWDALMQSENRENTLFLRVNKYATLNDNKTSNWKYCNRVLASYNRNVFFVLPPDVEPIELKGPVSEISLNAIDILTKLMISLYSASDFVSKGDGSIISGSNTGETNLFKNTIVGIQTKLLKAWEPLLNKILEWNGYVGFSVEITLPEPKFKNEELDFKKGHDIIDAVEKGFVMGSINEARAFFGMEDASPEFIKQARDEWRDAKVADPANNPFLQNAPGSPVGNNEESTGNKDESAGNSNTASKGNSSSKDENATQDEVSQDQEALKKNQAIGVPLIEEIQNRAIEEIPTEEELQSDLEKDLSLDVKEFFKAVSRIKR